MNINGTNIYCDCCGREKLAEIHPGTGIVIQDGRHGVKHRVAIDSTMTLEAITGTTESSAIIQAIQRILAPNG